MTTARLKWLSFLALALFVGVLDLVRHQLYPVLDHLAGRVLLDVFVLVGGIFLVGLLFSYVQRQERRLELQNTELLALHHSALELGGELGLATLLQKIVEGARGLIGARYGALSVIDRDGHIEAFVTSGIGDDLRERIGAPPVGKGLLGVVLHQHQHLRLDNLRSDPRAAGFPAHHPSMNSLLAVPISCRSPFRGNLYLADRFDGEEFSSSDEATLDRFATQAANAIDAVHLHERLRVLAIEEERLRLAREMHDGVAQILASVNARAQAVREHLRASRSEEATAVLDRLAADARAMHAEVREGILALRATASEGDGIAETLRSYLDDWEDQSGLTVEADIDLSVRLIPEREVQVLRIAQEALANIRKHAEATSVRIRLSREGGRAALEVADDGKGFDPLRPSTYDGRPHFGLLTMRERAQAVDGQLEIEAQPGRGTIIRLSVPIGRGAQFGVRRSA